MYLHKPVSTADSVKLRAVKPLVVALHGCNQNAESIALQSGWNKLADGFDFYVIYPEQKRINNLSDCFNWFNEKDITKNSGESGSIKQMIQFMRDSFLIDTAQIFVYGLSAGAAMTTVLMANYPGTFNTGAVLAGGPYKMATNPFTALSVMAGSKNKSSAEWGKLVKDENPAYKNNYPKLVVIHGKSDKVVNPENSLQLIKQWANVLHTDTVPAQTLNSFANNQDITKYIYMNDKKQEEIFYYEVKNLGHALMVDPGEPITQGGKTGLFAVDKNFFSTYWIAKDFGLIR